MNKEDYIFSISDHIHSIVKKRMGYTKEEHLPELQKEVEDYLKGVAKTMSYNKIPTVKVTIEGSFVAVNFFDSKNNRLDELGDMIEYMSQ